MTIKNPFDAQDKRALAGVLVILWVGFVAILAISAGLGFGVRVFMLTSGLGG